MEHRYSAAEAAKKRILADLKEQVLMEEEENPHPTAVRRLQEKALLYYIQSGDVERVREYMGRVRDVNPLGRNRPTSPGDSSSGQQDDFQIGLLSEDSLQQAIYLSISGITLFTRAAIDGGVPEHVAFATSDAFIREIAKQTDIGVLHELMNACMLQFAGDVFRYSHKDCSRITADCCQYIQRHLHDPITLTTLADQMHRTPNYISDLFAKDLGIRPTAYIRREKLRYAAKLLELTDLSVYRIAELLSFPSSSAFSSYFRKEYGCTPLAWRNRTAPGAAPDLPSSGKEEDPISHNA